MNAHPVIMNANPVRSRLRVHDHGKGRLRRLVAALAAIHLTATVLVAAAVWHAPAAGPVLGAVALAYVWGLQHGFAADHIAAVDDSTRLLVARGRRAAGSAGFAFATGHGITVTAATVVLVALTRDVPAWVEISALAFILVFLTVVCTANGRLFARLAAGGTEDGPRSLLTRLGGQRLRARVGRAGHLVPVGMVFGLASVAEVFTVVVIGQRGLTGGPLLPLALVVSFSAGLTLVDTVDSVLMARAYRWAQTDPARRRLANLTATSLTVVVSAGVALILAASLVVDRLDIPVAPLRPLAGVAHRSELVGAGVVVLFTLWWAGAWLVWQRRCAREAEPPARRPPSRTLPMPSCTAP